MGAFVEKLTEKLSNRKKVQVGLGVKIYKDPCLD